MSLWSRLFGPQSAPPALIEKASRTAGVVVQSVLGRPVWTPRDYEKLAREGYRQNVIAFSAIHAKAQAVARLPIVLQQMIGNQWREIEAHPILQLLENPNPAQDGEAFMRSLVTGYEISGNGFVERVMALGAPGELYALRSDRIKVIPGEEATPRAWEYSTGGRIVTLKAEDVMHVREPNPLDDWYGMSRFDPAAWSIDTHSGAGKLSKALLDNSARPSGALVYDPGEKGESLTTLQFERLKQELQEAYSGVTNAGRPMLLEGGLSWTAIGMTMKDMEFGEGKNQAAREIALAFGVPPLILGINGDNTFANYAEAQRAFYRDAVIPLAERFYRAFSRWLLPAYGLKNARLVIDQDDILALASERAEKWRMATEADDLTFDEKRALRGYEPLPNGLGNVVLVDSNKIPLADVGLAPEGGPEPEPDQDDAGDETDEPSPEDRE